MDVVVLDFEASACAKLARNASTSVFNDDSRFPQSDDQRIRLCIAGRENKHTCFRGF